MKFFAITFYGIVRKTLYLFGLCILLISMYMLFSSYIVYGFLSSSGYSYSLGLFEADSTYGYKLISNRIGYQFVPHREMLRIKTDENGNRVPLHELNNDGESILYLGDSFTFGDACSVDSTFPFLVEDSLGYKTVNGGVGGYGYAQTLIKADALT